LPSSSFVSSSPSSSSPGEIIGVSNQVAKNKKKGKKKKKKKKQIQQRDNQATIDLNAISEGKPYVKPHKVRYSRKLCAGDHLLQSCLDIPQILEEWSSHLYHPMSSTSGDHVSDIPTTSDNKVHGKKGKVKFPCRLCEGNHPIHLCPYLDEAKRVLDNHLASSQRLPSDYRKLSLNPSLVDEFTNQNQPSVETTLSESESYESIPDPNQQVKVTVDPISPSVNCTFLEESEHDTTQVLFVSSDSNELGGSPLVPSRQEENPPILITQGVNSPVSMVPCPSSLITSFNWNRLAGFCLPSYVPFQIIVQVCNMIVSSTIIDEGASVSILSSTTWQALGFPPLVLVTQNLLGFNRGTSQPSGILPQLPFTVGGKIIYLNVMVVLGPLDYNLLLGHDYVYDMGAIVSTLF